MAVSKGQKPFLMETSNRPNDIKEKRLNFSLSHLDIEYKESLTITKEFAFQGASVD